MLESPSHPVFTPLYQANGFEEMRFTAMRKAIGALKKHRPDYVVGEFFYGFGNNYAGVNVSNLDVFLHSLQKYSPDTKVIVMVSRQEQQYVEKLQKLFSLHAVLVQPVTAEAIAKVMD